MSVYSDAEMQIAAIISYLDLRDGQSLGQYMKTHPDDSRVQRIREIAVACNNGNANAYDHWRINVRDDRNYSGFYGCMIDVGNGDAIFSFRGSESEQIMQDWIGANGGLANGFESYQQERALEFVRKMYELYGENFNNFMFTGHSLGGNLAMYVSLFAPDEMRDKISQVIGFDSPGFSRAFWAAYRERIEEMWERIKHYQWSEIGVIYDSPGTTHRVNVVENFDDIGHQHNIVNLDTGSGSVSYRNPEEMTEREKIIDGIVDFDSYIPTGLGYIIGQVSMNTEGMKRVYADIVEAWNGFWGLPSGTYYPENYINPNYIHFEVDINRLCSAKEHFSASTVIVKEIREVLEDIFNTIKYNSKVGNKLKFLIAYEAIRMENLLKQAPKYENVMETALRKYKSSDMQVEEMFINLR